MAAPDETCPRCGKAEIETHKLTQKIMDWTERAFYLGRITLEDAALLKKLADELE